MLRFLVLAAAFAGAQCLLPVIRPQACYPELGCFPNHYPWTSISRPVPAPESPEEVGTSIYFYSRNNKNERFTPDLWPDICMEGADFDASREQTIFISHGYVETGNKSWLQDLKYRLLAKYDANVFLVDWGKGAFKKNYFQAASNTRIVGAEIARFIRYLVSEYNLQLNKVHLIGHSLGAHISSYAAKEFKGKIGQISALDAAQPGFELSQSTVSISKGDAQFVQGIHTNAKFFIPSGGFGMMRPYADVDIYVNGGLQQPSCQVHDTINIVDFDKLSTLPLDAIFKMNAACSHQISVQYFIESIDSDCRIWAFKISDAVRHFNALTNGVMQPVLSGLKECNRDTCTVLGPDAIKYAARGVFAATTTTRAPYCDTTFYPCYDQKLQSQIDGKPNNCVDNGFINKLS